MSSNQDLVAKLLAPFVTNMTAELDKRDAALAAAQAQIPAPPAPAPIPAPPAPAPAPAPTPAGLPAGAQVFFENVTEVSPGVFRCSNLASVKKASIQVTLAAPVKDGQTVTFRFKRKTNVTDAVYKPDNWKTARFGVAPMNYNLVDFYVGHTAGEGADQFTGEHTGAGKYGGDTYGYAGNPTKADVVQEEVYVFKKNGKNSTFSFSKDGGNVMTFPNPDAPFSPDMTNCPLQLFIAQAVAESSYSLPAGSYVEFSGLGLTVA